MGVGTSCLLQDRSGQGRKQRVPGPSRLPRMELPPAPVIEGAVHLHSGKVRDLYRLDDGRLLMVASDRISAYDFVLETPIPDKGEILTRMSLWWFDQLADLVPNHVLSTDVPAQVAAKAAPSSARRWRCTRSSASPAATSPAPGSPTTGRPARSAGCRCPRGSRTAAGSRSRSSRLPRRPRSATTTRTSPTTPWWTSVGAERAAELRDLTLRVYARAEEVARERGIVLADTKLEFGARPDGTTVLGDEVLTPDSSRFWPADWWQPGRPAAVVRQAVRPRLAHLAGQRLGPHVGRAAAAAARGGRRADPREVRRGLRAADRRDVLSAYESYPSSSPPWDADGVRRSAATAGLRLPRRPGQPARVAGQPGPGGAARRGAAARRHALGRPPAGRARGSSCRSSGWSPDECGPRSGRTGPFTAVRHAALRGRRPRRLVQGTLVRRRGPGARSWRRPAARLAGHCRALRRWCGSTCPGSHGSWSPADGVLPVGWRAPSDLVLLEVLRAQPVRAPRRQRPQAPEPGRGGAAGRPG